MVTLLIIFMQKKIILKMSVFSAMILIAVSVFLLSKNNSSYLTASFIVQRANAALSDEEKTIEHVKMIMSTSVFESWHDPVNNLWRTESKDLKGNIQNITIIRGSTVTQLVPLEKKASVTVLSSEIMELNKPLNNVKQFDLLKNNLSSGDWSRLPNAVVRGSQVYVIERTVADAIEKVVEGRTVKVDGLFRLYVDPVSFLTVKEDLYEKTAKGNILVDSNEREYNLVSLTESPELFIVEIPSDYVITTLNSNNSNDKTNKTK